MINPVISITIPVYNGENNLGDLYLSLVQTLERIGKPWEIIMVDDGSRDSSWERMKSIRAGDCRVKIIKLARNYGQQKALLCGLKEASGELILTMDDDLQHLPEEIPYLIQTLKEGHDLVFGVFPWKKHSTLRNLGSKVTNKVFNLAGLKSRCLKISSFRALTRELAQKAAAHQGAFVYLSAHLLKYARHPVSVEVRHGHGNSGGSRYSIIKLVSLLANLFFHYYLFPGLNEAGNRPLYIIESKIP